MCSLHALPCASHRGLETTSKSTQGWAHGLGLYAMLYECTVMPKRPVGTCEPALFRILHTWAQPFANNSFIAYNSLIGVGPRPLLQAV
jgi:hypothetical protein